MTIDTNEYNNMKNKYIDVKLNTDLRGFVKGKVLRLGYGYTKLDQYWKNRIRDSEIDNCLIILPDNKQAIKTQKETKDSKQSENKNSKKLRLKHVNN